MIPWQHIFCIPVHRYYQDHSVRYLGFHSCALQQAFEDVLYVFLLGWGNLPIDVDEFLVVCNSITALLLDKVKSGYKSHPLLRKCDDVFLGCQS